MLDRFHKVSEIVASFAIVGSLIFVGIQVNQNTNATRVSNAQAAMQVWSDHAMAMATSESLAQAYVAGINPEILEFGGITLDNAPSLIDNGAHMIAVIEALLDSPALQQQTQNFQRLFPDIP